MRILIWLLLAYLVYRMLRGKRQEVVEEKRRVAAETFQDPVCGVFVAEDDAVVGVLEGKRHYFCSRACLERFRQQIDEGTHYQSGGKG